MLYGAWKLVYYVDSKCVYCRLSPLVLWVSYWALSVPAWCRPQCITQGCGQTLAWKSLSFTMYKRDGSLRACMHGRQSFAWEIWRDKARWRPGIMTLSVAGVPYRFSVNIPLSFPLNLLVILNDQLFISMFLPVKLVVVHRIQPFWARLEHITLGIFIARAIAHVKSFG